MVRSSWVLKRLGVAATVLWATTTITFFMIRLMPGSPIQYLRRQLYQQQGGTMSDAEVARLVEIYISVRPDEPLWQQYINYLISVVRGDLGYSFVEGTAVTQLLADALPWTVFLLSIAILLNYTFGILLGALMAYYEGTRFDVVATSIGTIFRSIPFYIVGFVLIFLLAFQWGVFPNGGRYPLETTPGPNLDFLIGLFYHATLPIFSLVLTGMGGVALSMRANSIQVLGSDYIRGAKLRGLSDFRISYRYVSRNAILPLYTGLLISLGFLFGGSIILEEIFQYYGAGLLLYDAVRARDYPLMMGGFLIITIAVVIGVVIADLTYGYLDPRAGQSGETQ